MTADQLADFEVFLRRRALAPSTAALYLHTAARWARAGYASPEDALRQRGRAGSVPRGTAGVLKSTARLWYLSRGEEVLASDLNRWIMAAGPSKPPLSFLDLVQLVTILARVPSDASTRGVLGIMPWTGLRVGDACRLRREHIRWAPQWHVLVEAAGTPTRTILVQDQYARTFLDHFDARARLLGSPWLFPSPRSVDRPIPPDTVRSQLRRIRDELPEHLRAITPHDLRRAYAWPVMSSYTGPAQVPGHTEAPGALGPSDQ